MTFPLRHMKCRCRNGLFSDKYEEHRPYDQQLFAFDFIGEKSKQARIRDRPQGTREAFVGYTYTFFLFPICKITFLTFHI